MTLHPDYPVVSGHFEMTDEWTLELPEQFNRRVEDGSLVLWRPELTFWITVWGNGGKDRERRLASILEAASDLRTDQQIERTETVTRLTYELTEEDAARATPVYK